ncbi:MAG: phosphomannomutase [Hyphomicrobiales bacterium]
MAESGVVFGTSGARGLASAMTDRVCFAFVLGFLQHLAGAGEFAPGGRVAVAGDLRPSTPRIVRACLAAIRFAGGVPLYCGEMPAPALCYFAFAEGVPSLMVTGSHIPEDRNGIKFNRCRGEFLKSDEAAMREQRVSLPEHCFDAAGGLTVPVEPPLAIDVSQAYVRRYVDFFRSGALAGLRLGVYEHSAVGRDVLAHILETLGAETVRLGRSNVFVPVDTEAVRAEDEILARKWIKEYRLNALLTSDGDGDRPLLADETGAWLRGDVLGLVAARFLGARAVATPVSSNTALERSGFAGQVLRTRIGSPYVVAAMAEAAAAGWRPVAGYEANGGFLLASDIELDGGRLSALPTRDAVLPMLCALVAARRAGVALSSLVAALPRRYTLSDRLRDMPAAESEARLASLAGRDDPDMAQALFGAQCGSIAHIDLTDGVRMVFSSEDIVHLRASGNAPELRVYVEAGTPGRARELLQLGMAVVTGWKQGQAGVAAPPAARGT